MIKSITAINYLGEWVEINMFEDNPEHGMLIKSIKGLGPAKADINTSSLATSDGDIFNSSRLNKRNIVIQMYFKESPTIEDARQRTYKYFPIKRPVTLIIEADNRIAETLGYVESNEPDIFSKQESNQISIICPEPYFYAADITNVTIFNGVEPQFEFPFENELLDYPLLEMGAIENYTERTIWYDGDAEVGITIYIHAIGEVRNISIYNTETREIMRINTQKLADLTGAGLDAGDDIIINTMRGNKYIRLLRNGLFTNILNTIDDENFDWFQLAKGDNVFAYTSEYGSENIEFKIVNKVLYEGV